MRQTLQRAPGSPLLAPSPERTVASAPDQGSTILRLALLVALYVIPTVAAVRPVTDFDIWWHLRTAQWTLGHGELPTTDPFSSFGAEKPWMAYSWLFALLVYGLYQAFGLMGIVGYRVALSLAVTASLHRLVARREPRFLVATGLTGAAVFACLDLFNERSWLFTILFATWTLDAVLAVRAGKAGRAVYCLPVVYVIWSNIHIQFIYGLFFLGCACIAPVIDRLLGLGDDRSGEAALGSPRWRQLVELTAACTLATLVNPYHLALLRVILEYATHSGVFRLVAEFAAPDFRVPWDYALVGLTAAAAFALGRRKFGSFEVVLLAVTAYFSYRAQRDVWFLTLAALAVLVSGPRPAASPEQRFDLCKVRIALVSLLVTIALLATAWARTVTPAGLEAVVRAKFPVDAAAFVEAQGYPGPLYNHFNWGGYLIWRLPNLPVAIDGRTNLHGDARIERFEATWMGLPSWAHDAELAAACPVIAQAGMPLVSLLRQDPRFELVYEDAVAVVYVPRPERK